MKLNGSIAAALMLVSTTATAQERVTRFVQAFDAGDARGTTLRLDRAPESNAWEVRLTSTQSSKSLAEATLPQWAGAAYYSYTAVPAVVAASTVILLDATPGPDAPPDAAIFQVAFARAPKGSDWKEIANTRYTELDGGSRLQLRVQNNQPELILTTSGPSSYCGAKTMVQVYDPKLAGFRTSLDVDEVARGAEELTASLPQEPFVDDGLPNYFLWFLATSDRRNTDDSRTVIRPLELGDGKPDTAWVQGRPDDAKGQYVTARIDPSLKLRGFRILPGAAGSPSQYRAFSRPTKILASTETKSYVVRLPETDFTTLKQRGGFFVQFPEGAKTRCLTVALLDTVDGNATGDDSWQRKATAISEITPVSEVYGLPPDFAATVVVEKLLKESDNRNTRRLAMLTAPLGPELSVILDRVVTRGSDEDRARVAPLLRNIPSSQAVPILVDLFKKATPESAFYAPVRRGLEMHRELAGPQLVRMLQDSPPEDPRKLRDLVRMVGRLADPEDLRFLSSRLGQGDGMLRKERIRAVSRAGAAVVPDLFTILRLEPNSPASEDAIKALFSIGRKIYPKVPNRTPDADVLVQIAKTAERSRTRMAALRCLVHFDAVGAQESLIGMLNTDSNPLVRRAVIHALLPRDTREARVAIERSLRDDSPDVRIAAAEALARRSDGLAAVPALKTYTTHETWPRGLSAGYSVLAQLGDDTIHAFLEREMLRDPYSARAEIIADALKRGTRGPSSEVARQILRDEKTSFILKRHILNALGLEPNPGSEALLAQIAVSANPFPEFDERRNTNLQVQAVLALGRLRTATSSALIFDRLRDTNDLGWQRAYLRALSFSVDSTVAEQLEAWLPQAPASLQEDAQAAAATIRRRSAIKEIENSID